MLKIVVAAPKPTANVRNAVPVNAGDHARRRTVNRSQCTADILLAESASLDESAHLTLHGRVRSRFRCQQCTDCPHDLWIASCNLIDAVRAWTPIAAAGVGRQPASRMGLRSRRWHCRKAEFMTMSVPGKREHRERKSAAQTGER